MTENNVPKYRSTDEIEEALNKINATYDKIAELESKIDELATGLNAIKNNIDKAKKYL